MRILYLALLLFLFYRLGNFIPLPFIISTGSVSDIFSNITMTGVVNQQALQRMSLFSLGIIPYITAGILIQLVRFVFSDTEYGVLLKSRKYLSKQTLLYTLIISLLQSVLFLNISDHVNANMYFNASVLFSLIGGCFVTVWFSRVITSFGYGNGASFLIALSIIDFLSLNFTDLLSQFQSGNSTNLNFIFQILFVLLLIAFVAYIEPAYRPLKLIFPNKGFSLDRKNKNSNNMNDIIPLKINNSGVLPLIFAMSFSALLSIFIVPLAFRVTGIDFSIFISLLTVLMVAFFVVFYTPYVLNTEEITKNLKKSSILCENRRPGDTTKRYIDMIVSRLNYIAIFYLSVMVIIPDFIRLYGVNTILSGVSCVILVVVILDVYKRIQYQKYSKTFKSALG